MNQFDFLLNSKEFTDSIINKTNCIDKYAKELHLLYGGILSKYKDLLIRFLMEYKNL